MHTSPEMRLRLLVIVAGGLSVWIGGVAFAQLPVIEQGIVVRPELSINSVGVDYPASLREGGLVYVSTQVDTRLKRRLKRQRRGKPALERLWYALPNERGALDRPTPFMREGEEKVNVGQVGFDDVRQVAYVTRNAGPARSRSRIAKRLQVYERARQSDGGWGPPVPVEFADATGNDAHPALSPDGSLLIFASDRDGGFGGLDLWGARRAGGMWGVAFNLGPEVNTGGNEGFPFLHADGTLYFATMVTGEGGGGEHYDIAFTRDEGGTWQAPTFLGAPFNSSADDFALVVAEDNRAGYFASSRSGGLGEDDIYRFDLVGVDPEASSSATLSLAIVDGQTGAPLPGASVVYLDADTTSLASALAREIVTIDGTPLRVIGGERYMTDVNGEGLIDINSGTFLLEVAREGYEAAIVVVEVAPGQSRVSVPLTPKRPCAQVRLSVVEEGSAQPVPGARVLVNEVGGLAVGEEQNTGADGTALLCLPCAGRYVLTALNGLRQARPLTYATGGADCGESGASTTVTVYLSEFSEATGRRARPAGGIAAGAPLAAGTKFQMPDVYYALNAYRLHPDAERDLDELSRLMQQFPDMRIELGSHTDANGPAAFNRRLSQQRADEARRYLIESAGIASERVVAVGYGESLLRNGCRDGVRCGADLHRENRRTEVTILGEGYVSIGEVRANRERFNRRPGPSPRPASRAAPSSASYLVIAGTFETRPEAEPTAEDLRKLGYENVATERVPGVSGYAVIAERFSTVAEASQFARALREAHGRAAYVQEVARR